MSNLNPNIPNAELSKLMTTAANKRREFNLKLLTPQLLLYTFLQEPDAIAYKIIVRLQKERGFDLGDLVRRVEVMARHATGRTANFHFTDDFGQDIPLAEEMLVVLDEALSLAQSRNEFKASSGHALASMTLQTVTTYAMLQRIGITTTVVSKHLAEFADDGTAIIHDFVAEAKKGESTIYYQRQTLLRDLIGLISLTNNRHVILVGTEGSGRKTLAYTLAQLLAEGKGPSDLRSLVELNETALLEKPLAVMRAGLRRASGGVLLVPDIRRFFADRLRQTFPEQVSRDLHKAILGNEQLIIGTATQAEYDVLVQNSIIRQNTQRLDVPVASNDDTKAMLVFHKARFEREYDIKVDWVALQTAVTLASQYIKTISMPAAAIQLADRACALVQSVTQGHIIVPEMEADGRLDSEDIMLTASQMTKIPITKLNEDEQSKYANMVDYLHKRIIGQEEAVMSISRAVKTARVGLRDIKRPIGSFLFLGPSGVGKSELAKALAEFMFGSEDAMLILDMSEYQEESSTNRMIGSPPGYVGYEAGGQLTDFVREKPYTVVLFDEIEKAHPRVLDVLLQVMEEGRLTDGQGRLTTFSETVIIMTSNLGAKHMLVPVIGEAEKELVMNDVRRFLRPEFINRLDDVITFHQLTPPQLAKILDLMLKKEFRLAEKQGLNLNVMDNAKEWLLAQNDQPEFGARPLRRIIARHLREPLADFLLSQPKGDGETKIVVDEGEGKLQFDFE